MRTISPVLEWTAMWRLWIAALLATSLLHARRLPIRTYTSADGLARDLVRCIVQDSRGFLWFLERSPGVGFVVFDASQAGRSNPVIHPPAIVPTFPTKRFNPATDY